VNYDEVTYEGYGPGGVALYIEALTDNSTRTVADVRHTLSKHGGSLGTTGSVAWQFERLGQIYVDAVRYDEISTMEAALEAGASDLRREGDEFVVTTDSISFHEVQQGMRTRGIEFSEAELAMVAKTMVDIAGDEAKKVIRLLEALDDLDDVQKVWSNADVDEAAFAESDA
jgi:YebC/PmpR family DNA-binding regulatory protein